LVYTRIVYFIISLITGTVVEYWGKDLSVEYDR
jgi:hypothetical protein